jgi:hypothetical protein
MYTTFTTGSAAVDAAHTPKDRVTAVCGLDSCLLKRALCQKRALLKQSDSFTSHFMILLISDFTSKDRNSFEGVPKLLILRIKYNRFL